MKRLLITGANGFIGRQCIEPAIAAGYQIVAVTSRPPSPDPRPIEWRQADLLAPGAAEALIEAVRPSHVLNLAWVTEHGQFWSSPANLPWLATGVGLISAFGAAGGRRFVMAGSCAEYDWTSGGRMVEGVTPDQPLTFYGQIKLYHHQILMSAARQFGFSAATGRVFLLYGPHESADRLVPTACRKLIAGETAAFSSGTQIRDFLHVSDVARGLVALLNSEITGACNVSSGVGASIRDVVTRIGKLIGRPDLVRFGVLPDRQGEPTELVGDNARLSLTDWRPSFSLEAGLRQTIAHWGERLN